MYSTSIPSTYISSLDEVIESNLRRGDVIEIIAPSNCESGKRMLLLFLSMSALLPPIFKAKIGSTVYEVEAGGKGQSVIWMDCTRKFDVRALAGMMHDHLENILAGMRVQGKEGIPDGLIQSGVEEMLKNLHVFTPSSTLQLAATIQDLPDFIKRISNSKDIEYLIVDGLSSFHWSDRLAREAAKDSIPSLRYLLSSIAHVRSTLSPIIFINQWILNTTPTHHSQEGYPFFPTHFPSPYPLITSPAPKLDSTNPLAPIVLPNSDSNSFNFKYSISLYPPPRPPNPSTLLEGMKPKSEDSTMMAIIREAGGKEIGTCEFDYSSKTFHA